MENRVEYSAGLTLIQLRNWVVAIAASSSSLTGSLSQSVSVSAHPGLLPELCVLSWPSSTCCLCPVPAGTSAGP